MKDEERLREALGAAVEAWQEEYGFGDPDEPAWLVQAHAALHPAESFYTCPTCGENVTRYGQRCPTCEQTERVACVVCGEPAPIYRAERLCTRCFYRLERESGR